MYSLISFIFFTFIFGQAINHQPIDNADSNLPLRIEIEIIPELKKVNQVSLFYRNPNQENYFQLEFINLQNNYYFSNIPEFALDNEYLEYIIIAEFNDGSTISYPRSDPFNNPHKIDIQNKNETIKSNQGSDFSKGGSLKSNALILSPLPNSNVNKDDVLIALSLFSVKEPNLEKIKVLIDDIDVTENVVIDDNLLTYIPEQISSGLHKISILMENKYGIKFQNINWSFNIVSSFLATNESTFKRSGKISSDLYQSIIDNNSINYNTYNFNFRANWDWLDLKSNVKLSSLESIHAQPRNRFKLDFKTPFLLLKLGDVNPELNQYALWGTRIRGFESQLKYSFLSFKITQGELTRAVQGESIHDRMVITDFEEAVEDPYEDINNDGTWTDAEEYIDLEPYGQWDPGETFSDCGYDELGNLICTECVNGVCDETTYGDGEYTGAEPFSDCGFDSDGNYLCDDNENWNSSYGDGIWNKTGNDVLNIGRNNYVFKNTLVAFDLGLKYKKKIKLNFHFLKSRDNTQSIYKEIDNSIVHLTDELEPLVLNNSIDLFSIDTTISVDDDSIRTFYDYQIQYESLINNCNNIFGNNFECNVLVQDWSGNKPQDNIVFGSDFSWKFDEDRMLLQSGFSLSFLNTNIWDPVFTSANLDTLSILGDFDQDDQIAGLVKIPFEPSDYQDTFIINENMLPLLPFDPSSGDIGLKQILHMSNLAYHYKLNMKYLNHNIVFGYRQIGPNYNSLGNQNIQKNIRETTFSDKVKFFNNRMFIIFKYQKIDDGVLLIQETIASNKKMDLNINLYPGVGVPTFSLGIGVNTRDNGVNGEIDSRYFIDGSYYNQDEYEDYQEDLGDNFNPAFVDTVDVDISNRDYTKTIKTNILITNQFKYNGFHNISLNLSNSNKIDLLEVERGPEILNGEYYSPASTNEAISFSIKSVFVGGITSNLSVSKNSFTFSKGQFYQEQELNYFDLMFGLNKLNFFKSIDIGGNISIGNGTSEFSQYALKTSLSKSIYDILLFKSNFEYKRKITYGESVNLFNNYQITANLIYTF